MPQNACCVTLVLSPMTRRLALLTVLAFVFPSARDGGARHAPGARALARRRAVAQRRRGTSTPVPARRHPLAGAGRLELRTRAPGGAGRAGSRSARTDGDAPDPSSSARRGRRSGWRTERAGLGRARGRARGSRGRPRDPRPRADGAEPRLEGAAAADVGGRDAADRAAKRLAGGRVDPQGEAGLRRHAADGATSTTRPGRTRYSRLAGAGGRPGDRGLPREGERLERHRLQRARRPLRHGLRGTVRRHRPERRRRAREGVQHRARSASP